MLLFSSDNDYFNNSSFSSAKAVLYASFFNRTIKAKDYNNNYFKNYTYSFFANTFNKSFAFFSSSISNFELNIDDELLIMMIKLYYENKQLINKYIKCETDYDISTTSKVGYLHYQTLIYVEKLINTITIYINDFYNIFNARINVRFQSNTLNKNQYSVIPIKKQSLILKIKIIILFILILLLINII